MRRTPQVCIKKIISFVPVTSLLCSVTVHGRNLEKDLHSELSGSLRSLLLSLLQGNRPEGSKIDLRLAAQDVRELLEAEAKKTSENKLTSILVTR